MVKSNRFIYFLLQGAKIVYIGQTVNVTRRLRHHKDKIYDSVRSIQCDVDKAEYWEQRLIKYFSPYYNVAHKPIKTNPEYVGDVLHKAFFVSVVAQRYYREKTGEELDKEVARKRWAMTRNPDLVILKKVFEQINKEQKSLLK